ncbi:MAG: helix-turn-helix domain-containing protein [Chloroflexia bacterium]
MGLNTLDVNIGERIRSAREHRRISIGRLALASGLSKGFISQVEHGRSQPSLQSLSRIAASMNLPLQSLLGSAEDWGPTGDGGEGPQLPQVFKIGSGPASQSAGAGVARLLSSGSGTLLSANLAGGVSVAPPVGGRTAGAAPGPGTAAIQALCVVIAGEVLFSQDGEELRLGQGDVLAWDASKQYRLENPGAGTSTLLLNIGPGGELPVARRTSELVDRAAARPQFPPVEGPLRLVAMRAQRRGGGR